MITRQATLDPPVINNTQYKCKICGGTLIDDGEGVSTCMMCGRTPIIKPETPKPVPSGGRGDGAFNMSRHKYYMANKATILRDIDTLGVKEALRKWGISSSTWSGKAGLAVQWGRTELLGLHREYKRKRPDPKPDIPASKPDTDTSKPVTVDDKMTQNVPATQTLEAKIKQLQKQIYHLQALLEMEWRDIDA